METINGFDIVTSSLIDSLMLLQERLFNQAKYDKVRADADSTYWSTGLFRMDDSLFFLNGARYTLNQANPEESVLGALHENVQQIQELTYYGYLNDNMDIFDTLVSMKENLRATLNSDISSFAGERLVIPVGKSLLFWLSPFSHLIFSQNRRRTLNTW
jgi:hypothetical protein